MNKVYIKKGIPSGTLKVPPSKSFAHRYLMGALLAGNSIINNIDLSDDIVRTLNCLNSLGYEYEYIDNQVKALGYKKKDEYYFEAFESGSTLRFMIPLILTKHHHFFMKGSPRLITRGVKDYENCLRNISFKQLSEYSIEIEGKLVPGDFYLNCEKSSQYLTGLLFALPLLEGDSKIHILGKVNSANYIDMTLKVLNDFGIDIEKTNDGYKIPGHQKYHSGTFEVEGDYSNAAFLDAFNYLGGHVELLGLNPSSLQGDKVYIELFKKLADGYCDIDVSNAIDLAPVLFTFAGLHHGAIFKGTSRLAIKESNRALAMKEELSKVGILLDVNNDEVIVKPLDESKFVSTNFDSHNDHRIAMALSLLASKYDIEINGYFCVNKSFPGYFKVLENFGMEVKYDE